MRNFLTDNVILLASMPQIGPRFEAASSRQSIHEQGSDRLAKRSGPGSVALTAVGILGLVLCLGIGLFFVKGELSSSLGGLGYVALAIGGLALFFLGLGLARLIRGSKR